MKKIMGTILVITSIVFAASADEAGKLQLKGSWRSEIKGAYIAEAGILVHDQPVWENELTLRFGESGWYAGIWSSFPFERQEAAEPDAETAATTSQVPENPDLDKLADAVGKLQLLLNPPPEPAPPFEGEIDLYLGRECQLRDWLKLDLNLSYYGFNELEKLDDDQWGAQVQATVTKAKWVEPYLKLTYYGEVGHHSPQGGWYLFPGVNFHLPLGKEQKLDLGVRSALTTGFLGKDGGYVYTRIVVSTDFRLHEGLFLVPSLMYQIAGPGQTDGDKDYVDGNKLVAGLGLRFEF
ncbi:MAG: hypothetical protein WC518_04265 [Patescibacteria group bacterium]